ncbi:spermine/spermidine acetyltransferase, putative [Lachnospiraceae bacterium KM106-2]|nr:spermine/spermidine acetyltransferase, putative [Lachnospiraceae bacterium KM106-2]
MIYLKEIDRNNFIDVIKLSVYDDQKDFISDNVVSLAQAKAQPECIPLAIYNDDLLVGFVMYCLDYEDNEYWIYRLMIDKKYQKSGYGKKALFATLNRIAKDTSHNKIYISFEPENKVAQKLYENVGFRPDGRIIDDEIVYYIDQKNIFNLLALTWDDERRITRAKNLSAQIQKQLTTNDITCLDFGCGTGLLTYELYPYVKSIYGYDTSTQMCQIFKEKSESYHTDNVHILTKPEEMQKQQYDLIFSSMVFHHIIDIKSQILILKECLKQNGIFLLIDLDEEDGSFHQNEPNFHGHNGFKREAIQNTLHSCGFTSISVQTVYKGAKQVDDKSINYSLFMAVAHK